MSCDNSVQLPGLAGPSQQHSTTQHCRGRRCAACQITGTLAGWQWGDPGSEGPPGSEVSPSSHKPAGVRAPGQAGQVRMAAPVCSVQLHGGQGLLEAGGFPDLQHCPVSRPRCPTQPCIGACGPCEIRRQDGMYVNLQLRRPIFQCFYCWPWLMDLCTRIFGAVAGAGSQSCLHCIAWLGTMQQ